MSKLDVEDTLRDFWATRPRRHVTERKCAGVAAGIAHRYGIDPVLVRVGFVVATVIGGAGIVLYLLGWLLLPADGDQVSGAESLLGRGSSSMSVACTICVGVALIAVTAGVLGGEPSGLVWLALAAAAVYLLHRHRAALGETPPVTTEGTTSPERSDVDADTAETHPTDAATPPAWDPLGTAPFAWDLPEPGPAPAAPPPRRRVSVTSMTLGLALVAGGVATPFLPALGATRLAGLVLGVIALGLLIGSVVRSGRGLIAVAVPLAAVTILLVTAPVQEPDQVLGEGRWSAVAPGGLEPRYELVVGNAHLDLHALQLPEGRTARTTVAVAIGESKVFLPPELDVELTCRAGLGAVNCLGQRSSGLPSSPVETTDYGIDGPGGGRLVLDVRAGIGTVEVTRG